MAASVMRAEDRGQVPRSELAARARRGRRYRRPHIERVWVMRPVESTNNSISGPNDNFSDPVRSFAVAIRDPETFVRYLRQEERRRLGKQSGMLPNARYVQMEVLSPSETQQRTPVLNMVVEQDDEMDMNSFVDLMEQVSAVPAYHTKRSRSEDAETSVYEGHKPRRKMRAEQHSQQRQDERNIIPEGGGDIKLNEPEEEVEQRQKEQPQRRPDQRRYYRQRVKISDPLLVFGEYGKRKPNYSRPITLDFNRSKSHDIPTAPSLYLLPPAVSTFKHLNVPQDVPTSTETPVPKSSRQRNRSRTHNSRRPVDATLQVHDRANPLSSNISRISTDIPLQSADADISLVHIDIPRIYTTISHPYTDVPASPFTDISRVHIAISRQPAASSLGGLRGTSLPKASEPTTVTPQSTEDFQSVDGFRQYADTSPPPADVTPPFAKFTRNSSRNEELLAGNSPAYDSYESEAPSRSPVASLVQLSEPVYPSRVALVVQAEGGDGKRHRDHEYEELQLTAAETAYYKRRQLRKPAMILETSEETGSIPGVPGRDYPVYSRPPKTNFSCVKGHGGYFADVSTRCQVFFVCSDDGLGVPMLCPNGTLFNQDFLVCDWWFNVACGRVP
ncbi:uncharacterized protein LOC111875269 isoform X2 [Cryptotermes secundus]|nr:uncharacterized protein LOC111875269 isoform X2 [Cryptotermes secundus]